MTTSTTTTMSSSLLIEFCQMAQANSKECGAKMAILVLVVDLVVTAKAP